MPEFKNAHEVSSDDEFALAGAVDGVLTLVDDAIPLEALLTEVAVFAAEAVPGADGAGVTMSESGMQDIMVSSAAFVTEVDSIQYRLGEGPCVSAAALAHTTVSGSLGKDTRWPTFGSAVADQGVNSALSLPLRSEGKVFGTLNVYAHAENAFGAEARRMGEIFAVPAAIAVHNARLLHRLEQRERDLLAALAVRTTIDRAAGFIMNETGLSAADAYARLQQLAQQQDQGLEAAAARVLGVVSREPGREHTGSTRDHTASILLNAGPDIVTLSRRRVLQVLSERGVGGDATADVELLVSEVVSNFVRHEDPPIVRVDVTIDATGSVNVNVTGHLSSPSQRLIRTAEAPHATSTSGRGLGILDSLTAKWGTTRQFRTTSIWFVVHDATEGVTGKRATTGIPESPG